MNLHIIHCGLFKLDGGAMFGVVPKSIWQKTNPADESNLCTWALRCLLIEDGNRLILIDTGAGDKQDEKFFRHYYMHGDYSLESSLKKAGFASNDITDVFLTHLHFDHCGGATQWNNAEKTFPTLTFPNATYWSNQSHWDWATFPNAREKASFLHENIQPIKDSGQLQFIDPSVKSPFTQMDILYVDGHTEKMMIPHIKYKDHTIVFAADLLPSTGHIPLPYVMGYDTRPLLTMEEKALFLQKAVEEKYIIFFEHDAVNECCTLKMTDKGPRLDTAFPLKEILT
ncbi:MAG: MBL fold metallo-hydrolase [Cyclobacteriaceae bacterium]|nr:MBL fold metallo-hydrolase [Cyclobacteriaceae bacterium]